MSHDLDSLEIHEEAQKWLRISEILRQWAEQVPPTDWTPTVKGSAELYADEEVRRVSRISILATFSGETLKQYIAGCGSLVMKREMPALSEPAKYWLKIATLHCGTFCLQHVCSRNPDGPQTMVPYPPLTDVEMSTWLYTEWWPQTGLAAAVMQATSDRNLFYAHSASLE